MRMGRLRVALYYPWIYLNGGPERTITEILPRSRHRWTLFTHRYEAASTFPSLREARIVELPRVSVRRSYLPVARAAFRIALEKLPLQDQDVLVVFCEGLGDLVTLRNTKIPLVCLCFTPLRAAFDTYYQQHYLDMKGGRFWRAPILHTAAAAYRVVDRLLWKRYRRVFAVSQEVRRRIVAGRLFPEDRVELLYPGVDLTRLRPSGIYRKDFLIPGRIMWTKNLELALDAFLLLGQRRPDLAEFTLTIAGFVDEKSKPYLAELRRRAAGCDRIRFHVAPTDEEMTGLCQSAYTVLYPPFNEDWGLAPLEAMACEKPVIATNRGGPRESILDGETGLLVEPSPQAFAAAMETLADNPELVRRMGARGRARAREFEWSRFCEKLDTSLEELVLTRRVSNVEAPPVAVLER